MDAASSIQVLVAVAALTIALIAITRLIGMGAAAYHPTAHPSLPAAVPVGPDIRLLVAILTAAAAEILDAEAEDIAITSIAELSSDPGHHWPRQGRFQRIHGRPTTRF
ncbi:MAG: hypothetical protein RL173_1755 [Fibrobacterota bacterium]|jgi:hypothetical protein